MPDSAALPSVSDYLAAYQGAVRARHTVADVHRGSRFDALGGVSAILFQRVSTRDRDAFRARYFDTAQDVELDELTAKRFADVGPRIGATKGQGTANLSRATATAGSGTLLAGTRITAIQGGASPVAHLEIAADTPVGAAALQAKNVPVQFSEAGAANAISISTEDAFQLNVEDPLWDNSWQIDSIQCASGTDREKDSDYQVRIKAARTNERPGYVARITQAMVDAGAARIALFSSDYAGTALDFGLNRICVGDASSQTSAKLLRDCRMATYDVCVLGTAPQVLPMTQQALSLDVEITLWDTLDRLGRALLSADVASALLNYFQTRQNPFLWRTNAMEGVALKATRQQAQAVVVTPSSVEPVQAGLFDAVPLVAWVLDPRRITISFST